MGLLLAVTVTAANLHDGRAAPRVLGNLSRQTTRRLDVIYADNKYRTDPLDAWLRLRHERYRIVVVSRPPARARYDAGPPAPACTGDTVAAVSAGVAAPLRPGLNCSS